VVYGINIWLPDLTAAEFSVWSWKKRQAMLGYEYDKP